MDSVTRIQNLNKAVCILQRAISLDKGMFLKRVNIRANWALIL